MTRLAVYRELLKLFPDANCAGPMLRISDVPKRYPLYNRVMNRMIEQFWYQRPAFVRLSGGRQAAVLPAFIDTTFALYRAGTTFRRHTRGIRVYRPYEARHLDWYQVDGAHTSSGYEITSSPQISHWNNQEQRQEHEGTGLLFDHYFTVEPDESGDLHTVTVHLDSEINRDQGYAL